MQQNEDDVLLQQLVPPEWSLARNATVASTCSRVLSMYQQLEEFCRQALLADVRPSAACVHAVPQACAIGKTWNLSLHVHMHLASLGTVDGEAHLSCAIRAACNCTLFKHVQTPCRFRWSRTPPVLRPC